MKGINKVQEEIEKESQLETHSEKRLANALQKAEVPVTPQYKVEGHEFDFKIKGYQILIEVDGPVHNLESKRKIDYQKDRKAQKKGYKVLRFDNFEINKSANACVKEIKKIMRCTAPEGPPTTLNGYIKKLFSRS